MRSPKKPGFEQRHEQCPAGFVIETPQPLRLTLRQ
jgi:hypothetical protein